MAPLRPRHAAAPLNQPPLEPRVARACASESAVHRPLGRFTYGGKPFLYERTGHGCRVRSAKEGTPEELEEDFLLWTLEDDQIPAMAR